MHWRRIGKFQRSNLGQVLLCGVFGAAYWFYHARHHAASSHHGFHEVLARAAQRGFPPGMLISIVMFVAFGLYWDVAGKSASEAKTSESSSSRGFHLALVSLAQILVLLPVRGLRTRFLPESTPLVIVALALETAFFLLAIWARQLLGRNWSGEVWTMS